MDKVDQEHLNRLLKQGGNDDGEATRAEEAKTMSVEEEQRKLSAFQRRARDMKTGQARSDAADADFVLDYLRFLLALREREILQRPMEQRQTQHYRTEMATYKQTCANIKPLTRMLKKRVNIIIIDTHALTHTHSHSHSHCVAIVERNATIFSGDCAAHVGTGLRARQRCLPAVVHWQCGLAHGRHHGGHPLPTRQRED